MPHGFVGFQDLFLASGWVENLLNVLWGKHGLRLDSQARRCCQEPERRCRDEGAATLIVGHLSLTQSPETCPVWYCGNSQRTAQPGALLAEGSKRGDSLTVILHHSGLVFEIHLPTEVQTRMGLCQLILDSFISSSFTHG